MSVWCKHYNGCGKHDQCAAGITYKDVVAPDLRGINAYPCFPDSVQPSLCHSRQMPTAEEIAAEDAELAAHCQQLFATRKTIIATGLRFGSVPCQRCSNGRVNFSIAPNGHVRASCTTRDCLTWIE